MKKLLFIMIFISSVAFAQNLNELYNAAKSGDVEAQFEYGLVYLKGDGVKKDYTISIDWLQRAALKNHIKAQYYLGRLYETAIGAGKNSNKATIWYQKACDGGLDVACKRLEEETN
ncbi:MAG: sel1 repeat family protein [Arcobacter butzleri]|nr:sel1 repeat family protein [Aliarcobacter butzleri]